MTCDEISKMSNEELQKALAEALGWREVPSPGGPWWASPGDYAASLPNWPTDPAASAELRRALWKRCAIIVLKQYVATVVVDLVLAGQRRVVRVPIATDPVAAECRALAEAALMVLTEAKP